MYKLTKTLLTMECDYEVDYHEDEEMAIELLNQLGYKTRKNL